MKHYIDQQLLSGADRVNVLLVGCGGTGSKVLTKLCALNHALEQMGHPGFNVVAFDSDEVTEANLARQDFGIADLGMPKSSVLMTRINRYYSNGWDAFAVDFNSDTARLFNEVKSGGRSILVTCVDTAIARQEILSTLKKKEMSRFSYWLDLGNSKDSGQVVLGTFGEIKQPESSSQTKFASVLPNVVELFPDLLSFDETDNTPSCSLPDALKKQSLFINSIIADFGSHLLSNLFFRGVIEQSGVFVNLSTLQSTPLPIDPEFWKRQGWTCDDAYSEAA